MAATSSVADRRVELAERQAFVAGLLNEAKVEQLLLLEPPNLSWFAGEPIVRGIVDPASQPALIVSAHQRWLICSNLDTQRIFDSYVDDLGFQVKEWAWQVGRDQLLADLCEGRTLACDRHIRDAVLVADRLRYGRTVLGSLAQEALRSLGRDLARSLDATARNVSADESEGEAAGHLAHRLARRGIDIIVLQADGEGPILGPGNRQIGRSLLLTVIGRRDGLHASASRTAWFAEPDSETRRQFDAAGQIAAGRESALIADGTPAGVFDAGQRVAVAVGQEHAWHSGGLGHLTGWLPVELLFTPATGTPLAIGQSVTLTTRVGSSVAMDTYLITPNGPERVTTDDEGPLRRYKFAGRTVDLPDATRRYVAS
ncbi:MAG: hypothetical protein K1X57_01190 [Gemmataceae bacterium]|nr:hypothetical protein [Gemmataceae bacterium]